MIKQSPKDGGRRQTDLKKNYSRLMLRRQWNILVASRCRGAMRTESEHKEQRRRWVMWSCSYDRRSSTFQIEYHWLDPLGSHRQPTDLITSSYRSAKQRKNLASDAQRKAHAQAKCVLQLYSPLIPLTFLLQFISILLTLPLVFQQQ